MVRLWLVERDDSCDVVGGIVDGGGDRAGDCPLDTASRAHVVAAGSAANRTIRGGGVVRSQYPNDGRVANRRENHVRILEGHGGHGYRQYRPVGNLFGGRHKWRWTGGMVEARGEGRD